MIVALLVSLAAPAASGVPFDQAAAGGTLSILAPVVEVASGSAAFRPGVDGQVLQPGDQVRTTETGVALVTLFDGSEVQLGPGTLVTLDAASATGSTRTISIFQGLGTTVNRLVRGAPPGSTLQTVTPNGASVVRGTTYAVTVSRLPGGAIAVLPATPLLTPTPTPAPPTAAATGVLDPTRVTSDESGNLLLSETTYADADGEMWRRRTWMDPATGQTWDTYTDLGPADQQIAAQVGPPTGPCGRNEALSCVSAVLLLSDPDGSVGRVQVQPSVTLPPIDLIAAGDLAAVSGVRSLQGVLSAPALNQLTQTTRDLRDPAAATSTASQSREILREATPLVAPNVPLPPPPVPPPPGGTNQFSVQQITDSSTSGILPAATPTSSPSSTSTPIPTATPTPPPPPHLTDDELAAFLQASLGNISSHRIIKWTSPIKLQVDRGATPDNIAAVDRVLAELRVLIAPVPIERVTVDGNVVAHFVPRDQVSQVLQTGEGTSPIGSARVWWSTPGVVRCEIAVSNDQGAPNRTRILQHELGHCMGLDHLTRPDSVMLCECTHTAATSESPYPPIDRVILTALYTPRVHVDMTRDDLLKIFR